MKQVKRNILVWVWLVAGVLVTVGIEERARATNQGDVLHVANNGMDSLVCGSKANPCRSISQAITNASAGNTLLVGPGRYGDLNRDGDFDDPGEEAARLNCGFTGAVICVDKRLNILSTNGAHVTVLDAAGANVTGLVNVVAIITDRVNFGDTNRGFTIRGSRFYGLRVAGADNVRVVGNVANNNGDIGFIFDAINGPIRARDNLASGASIAGFLISSFGGRVILTNNTAAGNDVGFEITGSARHVVENNTASHNNLDGFAMAGDGYIVRDNTASSNNLIGFHVNGQGHIFHRNTAVGNQGAGFYFNVGAANNTFNTNNIFGNLGDSSNCGLINNSGNPVHATNNFWGAASGPGLDPADNASSGCDISGDTIVEPFATKPFKQRSGPGLVS